MKKSWFEWFLLGFFFYLLIAAYGRHDDSDPPGGHSDMSVYRDELTGCEYLGHLLSGMVPRMDENGKQVCRKKP